MQFGPLRLRVIFFSAWLALLLSTVVLLVPWRFEGEVFMPGSGQPSEVSLPERHWAPLFAPPKVDPAALGLGIADERFQVRLHPVLDRRRMALQLGSVLLVGLVVAAFGWFRQPG